jgi:tetratricopeptide (TPR) repeat protein
VILHCLNTVPSSRPLDAAEVINGLEKQFLRKESLLASALVISVSLAAASQVPMIHDWLADHLWPPPASVRLAVLPFEGLPEDIRLAGGGILQDVSDRISHLRSGRRTVVVIPPVAAADNHAQTPEQAKQVLHATHALQTTVHREASELIIEGAVIDLATQRHLRDFSRRYSAAAAGRIPVALTGEVSLALDLQGASAPEPLSSAATAAYDQGLYFLRRDDESFGEAISRFEEAAHLDPTSPLPLAGLVEAEIKRFGATKDERSIASAKRALHAAEELNPDSPRVRLASGALNEAAGQFGRALEDYRRVQSLEPRNLEALLRMANAYNGQNVPERALEAYHKAIELEPNYYEPYHALGVFYFYRGKYPQALEQFRKSIERAPRFEEYTNLGAVLDELGQDTEAEQALLTSVRLHRTGRALNSLGAMRAYQKRDAEAVEFYTGAIKEEPGQYVYFENLADSYRRLGRIGEAKTAYLKAIDLAELELNQNPNQGYPRSFVAYMAARLGDSKKARNEIEQALTLSPEDNKVIRNAVLTYEFLRQRDRAIAVLKGATPDLLRELDRHPDLADFRKDLRFQQLIGKIRKEGHDHG